MNLPEPGRIRPPANDSSTIPEGATISSYLVHHPSGENGEPSKMRTSIRFDSPVLGVIFEDDRLSETDRILGATRTDYPGPGHPSRGLEKDEPAHLRLHEDGRTLSIQSNTSRIDQLRILVAEDPEENPQ